MKIEIIDKVLSITYGDKNVKFRYDSKSSGTYLYWVKANYGKYKSDEYRLWSQSTLTAFFLSDFEESVDIISWFNNTH